MDDSFSKRLGYRQISSEIIIKEDAPKELREFVIQTLYSYELKPSYLRRVICQVLKTMPDSNNNTEYPYVENEVQYLISDCKWFEVYDIIEAFSKKLSEMTKEKFQNDLNEYFIENGYGWKLENGKVLSRGDEAFELSTKDTISTLENSELITAAKEIKEAIDDLSRRPSPDITGAIQHSLACLECVCREVSGDTNSTLGALINRNPNIIPKPLDQAIVKIWGYSSEQGRHLKEGKEPLFQEAELVVGLFSVLSSYISKKFKSLPNDVDEVPF